MFITVIAPEILLAKNVGDLTAIQLDLEKLQDWAAQDGVLWTRTHSLFANMGGFVIRRSSPQRAVPAAYPETGARLRSPAPSRTRLTESWKAKFRRRLGWIWKADVELDYIYAHGGHSKKSKEPTSTEMALSAEESSQPVLIHLLTRDILRLRSNGLLPRLPYITVEEINDKSKSDSLVRAITIVQITWMVIQIIVRACRSLAISQLEIAVIAFATCAVILYGVNWEKPKGVQVAVTIIAYPGAFPGETIEIAKRDKDGSDGIFSFLIAIFELVFTGFNSSSKSSEDWPPGKPIPNNYTRNVPWKDEVERAIGFNLPKSDVYGLLLGTTVFGAVHIAAWNFVFPTSIESLLWKVAAVLCTTMALAFACLVILRRWSRGSHWCGFVRHIQGVLRGITGICMILIPLSYVVCRFFLVVEIFRSLCFLPPSAYIATWATNVPHVA